MGMVLSFLLCIATGAWLAHYTTADLRSPCHHHHHPHQHYHQSHHNITIIWHIIPLQTSGHLVIIIILTIIIIIFIIIIIIIIISL